MNIKLDLSKFKHKESTKDSTTLIHEKDQHTITLAHGKLSKEHKAQLEALRDATKKSKVTKDTKKEQSTSEKSPKVEYNSRSEPKSKEQVKETKPQLKMADGGQVPYRLDEEEPITEQSLIPTASDMGAASVQQAESPDDFLPSKMLAPEPQAPEAIMPEAPAQPKPADFVKQKAGQQGLEEYARLDASQREQYLSKIGYGVPDAPPQPPQASTATPSPAAPEAMVSPEQQPMAPVAPTASPQAQAPQAIAPAAPQQSKPSDDYLKQVADVQHDFANGYITPKTYSSMFANESTLGKIGTIFGLLVSGAGAGMSRQPNMLMEMMDKEIQRDLDAQKSSKSNQMDFMKLAEQHIMNQANIDHLKTEDKVKARALAQQYAYMSTYDKLAKQTQAMPEGPAKINALNALAGVAKGIQDKALLTGSMLDTQFEALKRSPQLGKATPGQEQVDQEYAKEYTSFTTKGAVNSKNAINKLDLLANEIAKDTGFGEAGGGRSTSILPDIARSRDAIRRRDNARNFANATLKELFGGQLSDAEREAAAREYWNDALSNKENAKLLKSKIKELRSVYDNKIKQAKYFEQKGTLRGYAGSDAQGADFNEEVTRNGIKYKYNPDRNGFVKVK